MAKITGLLVEHGEKIVLGFIGLIAVAVIALGTPWEWYPKYPGTFRIQAEENRDTLEAGTWPEEEQTRFESETDIRDLAADVLDPMNLAKIDYDLDFFWEVIPKDQPAGEPAWLPVRGLIADAGRAILALGPHPDTLEVDLERAEQARLQALTPQQETNLDGPGGRNGVTGLNGDPSLDPTLLAENGIDPLTGLPLEGDPTLLGEEGFGGAVDTYSPDKYRPFVAVRGVFPLKEQLEAVRDALGVATMSEAYDNLVFLDFELERQQAGTGPDPWDAAWEPVDIEVAKDILLRSQAFDVDSARSSVAEETFTMPLPGRLSGAWGPRATHPAFAAETLDARRAQIEAWLTKKLLEYEKEHAAEMKEVQEVLPGGFSTLQSGTGDIRRGASTNKALLNDIIGELQQDLPVGLEFEVTPQMVEEMLGQEQNELLFRFIDFDVSPGNLYRYRVRLKTLNPNFDKPIDRIRSASVARGMTRLSDWSEPTEPTFVPPDTEFFVTDVDGRDDRFMASATIPIYDWHDENGTPVRGEFRVSPGDAVAGDVRVPLVDVALAKAEQTDVGFETGRLVVDLEPAPDRLDREHRERLGVDPRQFELPESVLLVDRYGEFDVRGYEDQWSGLRQAEGTRREWLVAYPEGGVNPEEYLDDVPFEEQF